MAIADLIREAGVVGCGGAGFPTHAKLKGPIEYYIVNGAECEPLLRTDRYIMTHHAPELVEALTALQKELSVGTCVIALKEQYREERAALESAIAAAGADIGLHTLESFYPAGDEQTLVCEVTGRVVPPAALPGAVGCVIDNVATVLAIRDALHGIPLTQKYLTVTGCVKNPTVLRVPVGTSYRRCLELAGGPTLEQYFLVNGGPMMGKPCTMEQAETAVVTKTTSGILVLPADGYHANHDKLSPDTMLRRAASACIQCRSCTELCPRYLLGHPLEPHRIMRKMATCRDLDALMDDPVIRRAQLCCECGVCETIACPMGLQPRTINALLKKELAKRKIRYPASQERFEPRPEREGRKIPTERAAARTGVHEFYHLEIKNCAEDSPDRVEIPLSMHIGAPAVPTVAVGDTVRVGDKIAAIPDGALGAAVHASIAGRVESVGERIALVRE